MPASPGLYTSGEQGGFPSTRPLHPGGQKRVMQNKAPPPTLTAKRRGAVNPEGGPPSCHGVYQVFKFNFLKKEVGDAKGRCRRFRSNFGNTRPQAGGLFCLGLEVKLCWVQEAFCLPNPPKKYPTPPKDQIIYLYTHTHTLTTQEGVHMR